MVKKKSALAIAMLFFSLKAMSHDFSFKENTYHSSREDKQANESVYPGESSSSAPARLNWAEKEEQCDDNFCVSMEKNGFPDNKRIHKGDRYKKTDPFSKYENSESDENVIMRLKTR